MFYLKKEQIKILLYFLYIFIFLYLSTDYLNLNDLIYVANQADIISFYRIAEKAPDFPINENIVAKHDAQRFLIPYLIGIISNLTNQNLFNVFKIINFISIFSLLFIILSMTNKLKLDIRSSIVFFSLFFCNPYAIRYGIFNPVQVHDIIFFVIGYLIGYGILFNKKYLLFFTSIFSLFLRQTAIAFILNVILLYIFRIKIFKIKTLILYTFFVVVSFFIIIQAGNLMSSSSFPISNAYNILFFDFSKIDELIRFFALPLVSFFPLVIIIFSKKKVNLSLDLIILYFICVMMIAQPILGGPINSGRNAVRIATLCYPTLLMGIFYMFDFSSFLKNNFKFYGLIIFFHLWSLHPTFSKINFFGILRF